MPYTVGNWTKSVLKTLKFIDEQMKIGKKLKIKEFPSGTLRNWIYPLKNAGYITEDGFELTTKGKELLQQLLANPPSDRRGKKRIIEE